MPVITRSGGGKVTAIWGGAQIRDEHGKMQPLHVGDLVKPGDVILTTRDGIVLISAEADPVAAANTAEPSDTDRVISGLNQGELDVAPGAGLVGGDSTGLGQGFRVERISEFLTPASIDLPQYEQSTLDDLPNVIRAEVLPLVDVAVEPVTVSLSASKVFEGANAGYAFTATLSAASQGVTTIVTDRGVITIEDGQTSGSITVGVGSNPDDVYVDPSALTATITSASGGNFDELDIGAASATATIDDTIDTTTVTLGTAVLDGNGNYYIAASIDHAPETQLTLTLSNGATVTFAANGPLNANSSLVAVPTVKPGDPSLTVRVTSTNAGGNFENLQTVGTVAAPTLVTADGLRAEYYGYNHQDSATWEASSSFRAHKDDGTFGELDNLTKAASIIAGRSLLLGPDKAPDATFMAYRIDYGIEPGNPVLVPDPVTGRIDDDKVSVRDNLGNNPIVLPGVEVISTDSRLFKFVNNDPKADLTAADGSDGKGLGNTTEATIRFGGQAYFDAGLYDFRITSDDGFRIKLDGQSVAEIDSRLAPTQSLFVGVPLSGGLVSFELLYIEWRFQSCLRIEVKSHLEGSVFKVLGSVESGTPLFSDAGLQLSDLQDLVSGTTPGTYVVRTGLELDGDNTANSLTGTVARDALMGLGGVDNLNGGAGNDRINGGQGDDILTGDTGRDVFEWKLGDQSTTALPARDVITDFDNTDYSGDVLDLRDLLVGESHNANGLILPTGLNGNTAVVINANPGDLADYLHFTKVGTDTVIEISSEGKFTALDRTDVDQVITLTGVNLVGSFTNDNQVINDLLARGKLITDVA